MKKLKIAVIGAGSTYTPELVEGFIEKKDSIDIESIYFMDISRSKLEFVGDLSKRMLNAKGISSRLILTESMEEAIEGADYVLAQVRVGGLDARIRDEKIPLKYNLLGQETTGAGGFMNAMRTIPVMMGLAGIMERLAPKAWLINFSNPSGIIAETILNNSDVKMMGLCNVPINMVKALKGTLPETVREFDYTYVGLNHLSWITSVFVDGNDILREQLNGKAELSTFKNIPETVYDDELLKATGAIPSAYLSYFYLRDEQVKHCLEAEKSRGEVCKELESSLLDAYKDTKLTDKPVLLEQRGGSMYSTAAVSLVDAIHNDKKEVHVVNVKNNGALSFMGKNDVVEVKCIIDKNGATPVRIENFNNNYIIGLMQATKAYEKLAAKAGLEGSREAALAALMVHPLIGDYKKAKGALEEMLYANKAYLPQFFKGEN